MPNLIILTGAGTSVESGISTFRDSNGLWEQHDIMDVATPAGYVKNPELVHKFYNQRRVQLDTVEPNEAHYALAKLEEAWSKTDSGFLLITQNIDDLHERSGTKTIAHIHGELRKLRCVDCGTKITVSGEFDHSHHCSQPKCNGYLRPDVVWFGEMPYHLETIEGLLDNTDIFISIGTSGQVMPANLFATVVSTNGRNAQVIEINPNTTDDKAFNRCISEKATVGVPVLVDELIKLYC